jgi:hypothetical protein
MITMVILGIASRVFSAISLIKFCKNSRNVDCNDSVDSLNGASIPDIHSSKKLFGQFLVDTVSASDDDSSAHITE